jgi:Rrf2 family protein
MKRDSRLFAALHILAHLAALPDRPLTSEHLAECLCTNPVVIRRTLAGLRKQGIVTSTKGHGGGWSVARPPADISLREVYVALGEQGALTSPPESDAPPGCAIEAVVARSLDGFYAEMETLLLQRLEGVTIADLLPGFIRRSHELTAS